MAQPSFAIASPKFHPQTCGVGDQSLWLAVELRRRGYRAEIFTRAPAATHPEAPEIPISAVEGRLPLVVAERIRRAMTGQGHSHLILQYVPQMWGASRLGSPAMAWLALAARRAGMDVTVVAHELFIEPAARPDLLLGATSQRAQMIGMAGTAHRLLVTTGTRVSEVMPFWRLAGRAGRPGVLRIGPNALPIPRVSSPGRCRLGVFSTLAASKRFDVVLDAFEQVWRSRPESELVMIGDMGERDDPRTAAVYAAVDRHPARAQISFTGKLPLAEVARQMAELDLYLFPMVTGANTRSSTLPVALGCALPVVALNGSQTDPQLFRDRENIFFASSLTAAAFGESALAILSDPDLSERLSRGARRLYDEHLSWTVIGDTFLDALGLPRAASLT